MDKVTLPLAIAMRRIFTTFSVLRVDQLWMVTKTLNGQTTNIIPGGALDRWDKGRTVHDAAINTGDAWDQIKIVTESQSRRYLDWRLRQ